MEDGKTATIAQSIEGSKEDGEKRFADFSDLKDGGILWRASLVLLHYMEKNALSDLKGKRVIELGSGSGHLGTGLAKLGAHVTCTEQREHGQLDRLEERVKAAAPDCGAGSIRAVECAWGEDGWQKSPLRDERDAWDTIILSELVYEEDAHDALLYTLQKLASPTTVVYSIFCDRPWSFMFFVKVHDAGGFKVEAIPDEQVDLLGMQPDAKVCMHRITVEA